MGPNNQCKAPRNIQHLWIAINNSDRRLRRPSACSVLFRVQKAEQALGYPREYNVRTPFKNSEKIVLNVHLWAQKPQFYWTLLAIKKMIREVCNDNSNLQIDNGSFLVFKEAVQKIDEKDPIEPPPHFLHRFTLRVMKTINTSNSTFSNFREGGFLYVDKTAILLQWIRPAQGQYFLARPRRFGKSLMIIRSSRFFKADVSSLKAWPSTDWTTTGRPIQ